MDEIAFAWTLFWVVLPFALGLGALFVAPRMVEKRYERQTSNDGFTHAWTPHHEDVAYWESQFPDMRSNRG